MRNRVLVLAFSILAAWSQPVFSAQDFESGNYWFERCQSKDPSEQTSCLSFVYGFNQGIIAQAAGGKTSKIYCMPDSVTYGQARDIWTKYMRDNPAERHKLGGVLLMISMVKAFPCKNGGM